MEVALNPRPQPLRPEKVKIKGDVEQAFLEIACSDPPSGRGRWTLRLLADEVVALGYLESVSVETVRQAVHEHEVRPWIDKTWCIPPEADPHFVCAMEDVLEIYDAPHDERAPVICMDEASRQLVGEVASPLGPEPGMEKRTDYEYERKETCNLFVWCEPLTGRRHVEVTDHRKAEDWAYFMRDLAEVHYPKAERIVLVMDNLNTHTPASLYKVFAPEVARRIVRRLELHHTPVHASWLNMAEIEIGILSRQCLDRRIDSMEKLRAEVSAWEEQRNRAGTKIHWTFTLAAARHKLRKVYPSIEG